MNKDKALSRQILLFMLSLTFTIIIVAVVGSYLFYSFIIENFPGGLSASNSESMTVFDWVWIAISSIISFLIALLFAFKLSAKILNPLSFRCHQFAPDFSGRFERPRRKQSEQPGGGEYLSQGL